MELRFVDALEEFKNIKDREYRIKSDIHTNKHYFLINGKMWLIGNGTGKYWTLLCNSRDAQFEARKMLGLS